MRELSKLTGYLPLLCAAAVILFGVCRIAGQRGKRALLLLIPLSAGGAGLWFLFCRWEKITDPGYLTLLAAMCAVFLLLRVLAFRTGAAYGALFAAALLTALLSGLDEPRGLSRESVLLTLFFLMSESSQSFLKRSCEESAEEYQNRLLSRQVSEVQNIYKTMRGWRHDYHNHMQSLKAYLSKGMEEEAKAYLERLESDLDEIRQMIETGNVALDAILNSKLSLAVQEHIEVDYRAAVPEELTVSDIDLCVLIGNLIDNGVEACQKLDEEQRRIRLYIGILRQQLYIYVLNSTNEPARRMDEEYITTKRGNHGHGLLRINRIVEKYDGYINRKNEPGVFVTEIMLPL